ncbi:MAG: tRNA-intron lyase [Candidatus Altiarchaeota archaeon]
MSVGILSGTKVLVGDSASKSLLKERGFGEEEESRLELSFIEAIYLVDTKALDVVKGKTALTFDDLLKMGAEKEDEFYNKYKVYADLRNRGLVVRTGLKFGTDFRTYERGETVGKSHSKKLVHVVPEEYSCSIPELARAVRLATNVNKLMI